MGRPKPIHYQFVVAEIETPPFSLRRNAVVPSEKIGIIYNTGSAIPLWAPMREEYHVEEARAHWVPGNTSPFEYEGREAQSFAEIDATHVAQVYARTISASATNFYGRPVELTPKRILNVHGTFCGEVARNLQDILRETQQGPRR
ncbi:hypothetical protein COV20_05415 [Candidatus Woesearchaeota archaeon CG10_big_fil_rev_8_21_14_0_10_45_16]|nr:MAG: hypothetical protein COV20_05415 [Candidatus Woesearchaeota archaeon CG10_big_fil_rev_8_21_14_0_10_45_16]